MFSIFSSLENENGERSCSEVLYYKTVGLSSQNELITQISLQWIDGNTIAFHGYFLDKKKKSFFVIAIEARGEKDIKFCFERAIKNIFCIGVKHILITLHPRLFYYYSLPSSWMFEACIEYATKNKSCVVKKLKKEQYVISKK